MRKARAGLALAAGLAASCGGNLTVPTPLPVPGGQPSWSVPERIDPEGTRDHDPRLAVSPRGEMVAVWHHDRIGGRGFTFSDGLRASRFTPEAGWAPSAPIPDTRDMGTFAVAMDDTGTAILLGSASVDGHRRVWASRAAGASAWSAPELVQEGGGDSYVARLVQPIPGVALAGWSEFDGTRTTLWSRPLDDLGWRRTQPIDLAGDTPNSLELAASGRGQALAIWYEATRPGGGTVFANVFDVARGWRGAQPMGSAGTFPVAGFDASGRALAVWNSLDGLRMNRFLPPSGWVGETEGPGNGRSTYGVRVAVAPSGQALVAWHEQNRSTAWELWTALYDPLGGWGAARQLSDRGSSGAEVVIDAGGRGVVLWDENGSVLAQAHVPATGWGRAERIGPGSRATAGIDARGNVTVIWPSSDGISFSRLAPGAMGSRLTTAEAASGGS